MKVTVLVESTPERMTVGTMALLAILLAACSSGGGGESKLGPDWAADTAETTAEIADEVGKEDSVASEVVADVSDANETAAKDTVADTSLENLDEENTGVIQPPPKGPPPHLFDCTADWDSDIKPQSPVAMGCWLDPACTDRMVVAHRGAGGEMAVIAPENSLSALRAAILMGVDGVELDVRDTLDGEFVLMHDGSALRTTGVDKSVDQMTMEEATSLQLLAPATKYEGDFSCDNVPSLDEALLLVKGKLFVNLDCKTDRMDLLAPKIVELDMLDSVVLSVPSMDKAVQARAAVPSIRIQIRPDTMEEVQQGIDLFDPDPDVFEVPWSLVADASPVIHGIGRKVSADAFGQDAQALLLDDLSGYQELFVQGADMLMTEYPPFLLELLDRWEW